VNLQPRKRRSPELNLTPLIDVVFLLLIFFMVSTTFQRESQIAVELPQTGVEEPADVPPRYLDIIVDREGRFYVNQQQVVNTDVETLKQAIRKAAMQESDLPVIISADANTPHQAVIKVMDAASQLGYLKMTFATRRKDTER
jgi:biopolymer transport protein ExbD